MTATKQPNILSRACTGATPIAYGVLSMHMIERAQASLKPNPALHTCLGATPVACSARSMHSIKTCQCQSPRPTVCSTHLLGCHARGLQRALDAQDDSLALGLRLRHVVRVARKRACGNGWNQGRNARQHARH